MIDRLDAAAAGSKPSGQQLGILLLCSSSLHFLPRLLNTSLYIRLFLPSSCFFLTASRRLPTSLPPSLLTHGGRG